jgi:starch phosphorylase
VEVEHRTVQVKVWRAMVGRIPLYLLDTDIPDNDQHDRLITHQLYGGDMEMRISQEIILGMGGVRALSAMGVVPAVWHMNEGHSVFLGLERIRQLVQNNDMHFQEAREQVRANTVFTTHTPVAAGHDAFPLTLKDKYFKGYWEDVGLKRHEFLELGLEVAPDGRHELFSLTVLALNLSGWCNGVSRLHGQVSSEMWKDFWPGVPADENLITYVTNGVHMLSWLAPEMMDLFDQHLGLEWRGNISNGEFWDSVYKIPDNLFWGVHQNLKKRMIERIRERCVDQLIRNGEGAADIREVENLLNPDYLTIGFARRFATYKRATLLFRDMERLERIVANADRPVQFVFAGKAHPADKPGQELLRKIYEMSHREPFKGRVVMVEGYDIAIARYLVSGVDVWLNTPQRPFEASGTSGMKVTMNGGINFSVLDGWWCEAAKEGVNGWSIGDEREGGDDDRLAEQDSRNLYQHLEDNIVPTYYQRNSQGIPDQWIRIAKESIKTIPPVFNTDRMVGEYAKRFYFPAMAKGKRLAADNGKLARELSAWKVNMCKHWPAVQIGWGTDEPPHHHQTTYGEEVKVSARVRLGEIAISDVLVEAYIVEISPNGETRKPARVALKAKGKASDDGWVNYAGSFMPPDAGRYTLTIRATPYQPELVHRHELGLICWLSESGHSASTHAAGEREAKLV